MKYTLIFLLSFLPLFGLTITYNTAQEGGRPYGMLHIKHDSPVPCTITELEYNKKRYTCTFNNAVVSPPTPKKTPLMDIAFLQRAGEFDVIVTPLAQSRLLNMDASLHESKEAPLLSHKDASHWVILIYEDLPFAQQSIEDGINFPIYYSELTRPNVGALDLNGAPISYVRSRDINAYLDMKSAYEARQHERVIDDAQEAMMLYPQTIFRSEFALYRLRSMDRLLDDDETSAYITIDSNDIINEGKVWMKSFPSDEHMPEVLFYIAKHYLKMGFTSDANYFLDILITEHPNHRFTKWGILLYADSLYNGTKRVEALRLYTDVLYSAQDLDMASEAAIRLAQNSIDAGKVSEAKEYLVKILNANAGFLLKDEQNAYALAEKLALNKLPEIAAQITEALLEGKPRTNPLYETLLKDTGLWYADAEDVAKAHTYLSRYQEQFGSGEYMDEVQEGLDKLFFELSETNTTKLEAYYDTLRERYDNEISRRAVVEKIKLFTNEKRYLEALSLDNAVREMDDDALKMEGMNALAQAAIFQGNIALENDQCKEAVALMERYGVEERLDNRKIVFECLMRLSRYDKAIKEAQKHTQLRDLRDRLSWMQNLNNALFENGQFGEVVTLSDDIYDLGILVKDSASKAVLRKKTLALLNLKQYDEALEATKQLQLELPNAYENIEIYDKIIKYAKTIGSDLLINEYATLALGLQEEAQIYHYSPEIEYAAIGAKERLGRVEDALEIAMLLPSRLQDATKRIQAFYRLGELHYKLGRLTEAKEAFEQCAAMDVQSPWRQMCEEHIALTEN
jgi:hypothetical protein